MSTRRKTLAPERTETGALPVGFVLEVRPLANGRLSVVLEAGDLFMRKTIDIPARQARARLTRALVEEVKEWTEDALDEWADAIAAAVLP